MRLPDETLDELNGEATAWRLLAPWDVDAGQRHARAPRRLHVPGALGRRVAERPAAARRRRRAPDAAVRRPGHVLRACATPPTSPGSSTSCSPAAPPTRCSTPTPRERDPARAAVIDFSMALGKVICVADPAEAAARDARDDRRGARRRASTPPLPTPAIGPGCSVDGDPLARAPLRAGPSCSRGDRAAASTTSSGAAGRW